MSLKSDTLISCLLALFASAFYLLLAANSIQESDGAEYALMAIKGGLLHPPGYPLYAWLTRILVKLFDYPVYALLSDFSAICQAGSVALLYLFCRNLGLEKVVAISLAIAWAFYYPSMRVATDAEVFALQNLLVTSFLLFAFLFFKRVHFIYSFLAGLFWGLSASNHHTLILWLPVYVGILIYSLKFNWKYSGLFLLATGIGLIPYSDLYFQIGSDLSLIGINSINEILPYIMRAGYGTFSLKAENGESQNYFLNAISIEVLWLPFALLASILLLFRLVKTRDFKSWILVFSFLLHIWFLTKLDFDTNASLHENLLARFYSLTGLNILVLLAYYIAIAQNKLTRSPFAISFLLLFPSCLLFAEAYSRTNTSKDFVVDLEAHEIANNLPDKAVFLSGLDRLSSGVELKQIELKTNRVQTIVLGLLKDKNYRKKIQNQLQLELESDWLVSDLLRELSENDYKIYAYRDLIVPKDFLLFPASSVWQVLPASYLVERKDLLDNMLNFCLRLPNTLEVNLERRFNSFLIRQRVFAEPFLVLAGAFADSNLKNQLEHIAKEIAVGHIQSASQACTEIAKQASLEKSATVKAYLNSDLKK